MKQNEDNSTLELPNVSPYLVITTTKKGFREFKMEGWFGGARWDSRIEHAYHFDMSNLIKCLEFAFKRRAVSVALVMGNEYTVLGQSKYPVELATRKRYLR